MPLIYTENRAGKPIDLNGTLIVPIENSVRIQPPGMWGVLLWRRPSAVAIQHLNGSEEIIKIEDTTRKAQILLLGIGVIVGV